MTPTYDELQQAYKAKAYRFFTLPFDINIFGIRSENSQSNSFDDLVGVAYKDAAGKEIIRSFAATTDPGKHWLLNPMNKKGTIIMVPGQYLSAYKIGLHGKSGNNPYKALEQANKMIYVRDNDKNDKLDLSLYRDKAKLVKHSFSDICATNIHRASQWSILRAVERYSAGCQVIQSPKDFATLLSICDLQVAAGFGSKFTYTLFEESDFR